MRKFSKLIVLSVIIIAMFSYYYVQAGALTDTFVKYKINTIEGDESLIEGLIVKGDYYTGSYNGESFKVSKDGTDYLRDEPLLDRFEDYYISDKVKQLRKENRQFMRMKDNNEESYIEHGDLIIYASVPYTRWGIFKGYLQIETYNRKTKEKNIAKIDTPDYLDYSMIENMYLRDDELYILVMNMEYDLSKDTEKTILNIHVYNLSDETVTNSFDVVLGETNYYSDFTNVFVDDEENPTELMITGAVLDYEEIEIMQEEVAVVESFAEEDEDFREVIDLTAVKKIDLQTGDITEISVKNMVDNGFPVAYNGSEIIFVAPQDHKLVYYAYNVQAETMVETVTVDTDANFISMWDFEMNIIQDNKLYTLINHDVAKTATLLLLDISSGELLYKGLIEGNLVDTKKPDQNELYFHTIELLD